MIRDGACSCKTVPLCEETCPHPDRLPVPTQAGIDIHREQYDKFSRVREDRRAHGVVLCHSCKLGSNIVIARRELATDVAISCC